MRISQARDRYGITNGYVEPKVKWLTTKEPRVAWGEKRRVTVLVRKASDTRAIFFNATGQISLRCRRARGNRTCSIPCAATQM